ADLTFSLPSSFLECLEAESPPPPRHPHTACLWNLFISKGPGKSSGRWPSWANMTKQEGHSAFLACPFETILPCCCMYYSFLCLSKLSLPHSSARYKQSLDPTVDEVKKLCTSLRRNAKEERVLFHYNGHGVPRPTVNGEIWVFNKNYTQYIPLSIYDLQTWMGSPSIFVYDCSNAGLIVKSFKQFALQREQELEVAAINPNHPLAQMPLPPSMKNCIQLAACEANELLPMIPDLPADLFTSCLTTPIKIALRWSGVCVVSRRSLSVSWLTEVVSSVLRWVILETFSPRPSSSHLTSAFPFYVLLEIIYTEVSSPW
ncbi:hypothetical protein FD755_020674, partial [Muntiacus reevesi]